MYRAPVEEIAFTLKTVCRLGELSESERYAHITDDLVDAILNEAGRFASEEIAPMNAAADKAPAVLEDGKVKTVAGWRELYQRWIEGGWNGIAAPVESGGMDLPLMLFAATFEMWNSGSMAFAIGPTLTIGAIEALEKHGSADLKETYLEKLTSGEWMGTMNLTEPQAGSDLGALKSRAERHPDGTYRIFGQKIYITYGDHDISDNIVHMVLARLPDAPPGTKGISMFLVPKYLVNPDGSLGARNDVHCAGVEHKMGIHGSPTCTMVYGDTEGAVGWLIGEENNGLANMFTMMNNARLAVGIQGLGIAERAYQQALAYANERRQGRALGDPRGTSSPISRHPNVKRKLLSMKARTQVARAICFSCAHATDRANIAADAEERTFWQERTGLLTPIAKALSTDFGVEAASLGVQVHGGMGYIEETGAAQHFRDARIAPIYEGTNGIQAIDLVTRKLPLSGGDHVRGFIGELREIAREVEASNDPAFGATAKGLGAAIASLEEATNYMLDALGDGRTGDALCGATPYLRLMGLTYGGALLARGALYSTADNDAKRGERTQLARFFCEATLNETAGLKPDILMSAETIQAFDAEAVA